MLMPIHNLCNLYTAQKLNESHHCAAKNMLCNTFYIFNFCFFFAKDDDKQVQDNSINDENLYPGIPNMPRPRDGGRSSISGKRYGFCLKNWSLIFGLIIVWVLQPRFPTILLPTGKAGFLDSTIFATWVPIIVTPSGSSRT